MRLSVASILVTVSTLFLPSIVRAGAGFTGQAVTSGYWASYASLGVDNVPYSRYTHLAYFVVLPTAQLSVSPLTSQSASAVLTFTPVNSNVLSLAGIYEPNIYKFVQLAHGNGTQVSLTVGGYTGSQYFSTSVGSARNRTIFARTLVTAMNKYGFDGLVIDWEYPNTPGLGNTYNSNDAANLVLLFQTLRSLVPNARLAMDAQITGIVGPNGNYLTDLTPFANTLDYITLMVYDVFGFYSPTTGPNNPLYACPTYNPYSIDQAFKSFTKAGVPAAQLIVGFPAYAYAYKVSPPLTSRSCGSGATPSVLFQQGTSPLPAADQGATGAPAQCGNYFGPANQQQYNYKDLVANGWLNPASGFNITRDTYSASLSLYNPKSQLFIPYDDPTSAAIKAKYVLSKGMAGMEIFDIAGDTAKNALAIAIRANL